jgi:hypothetical protein
MKSKNLVIYLVAVLLAVATLLNFFHLNEFRNGKKMLETRVQHLLTENEWLKGQVRYLENNGGFLYINKLLEFHPKKEIYVFLSGKVCSICVEKLLHLLDKEYNLTSKTLILVESLEYKEFIESFNDAFLLNFEYSLENTDKIDPLNKVIVFTAEKGNVKSFLEYSPDLESEFKFFFRKELNDRALEEFN